MLTSGKHFSDLAKHEDNTWKSIKGEYLNVALFTIPGRSEIAPRGLSKYTHINDGVIDLVLVKNVERKEFIRLLKRLGNTKNQVSMVFFSSFFSFAVSTHIPGTLP